MSDKEVGIFFYVNGKFLFHGCGLGIRERKYKNNKPFESFIWRIVEFI